MSENKEGVKNRKDIYHDYYIRNKEKIKERSANAYREKIDGQYKYNSKYARISDEHEEIIKK